MVICVTEWWWLAPLPSVVVIARVCQSVTVSVTMSVCVYLMIAARPSDHHVACGASTAIDVHVAQPAHEGTPCRISSRRVCLGVVGVAVSTCDLGLVL